MGVRQTGFAMLASSSVQEAHDLAVVAQAATLSARVPFVHFFDGFRTSHELNTIEILSDDDLRALVPESLVRAHRDRALSPEHPFIRGTAQNPDVAFQGREISNPFYARTPAAGPRRHGQSGRPDRTPLSPGRLRRRPRSGAGDRPDGVGRGDGARDRRPPLRRRRAGRGGHGASLPALPGRSVPRSSPRDGYTCGRARPDEGAGLAR